MHNKILQQREQWKEKFQPRLKFAIASVSGRLSKFYGPGDMLDNRLFAMAIGIAFMLHVIALVVWLLMPKPEVIDIPVQPLNIKLGDVNMTAEQLRAISPDVANNGDVERTIARLVGDGPRAPGDVSKRAMNELDKDAADQEIQKHLANPATLKQFVRAPAENEEQAAANLRYEQLVSMWIQKFKVYPKDAAALGIQGETAVRVRIDRRGNIRYFVLERSTGDPMLDRATIDMIRRANPVPAVPNDYPAGEEFEFLIPVKFHLE